MITALRSKCDSASLSHSFAFKNSLKISIVEYVLKLWFNCAKNLHLTNGAIHHWKTTPYGLWSFIRKSSDLIVINLNNFRVCAIKTEMDQAWSVTCHKKIVLILLHLYYLLQHTILQMNHCKISGVKRTIRSYFWDSDFLCIFEWECTILHEKLL